MSSTTRQPFLLWLALLLSVQPSSSYIPPQRPLFPPPRLLVLFEYGQDSDHHGAPFSDFRHAEFRSLASQVGEVKNPHQTLTFHNAIVTDLALAAGGGDGRASEGPTSLQYVEGLPSVQAAREIAARWVGEGVG